jgi:hypothetical protein
MLMTVLSLFQWLGHTAVGRAMQHSTYGVAIVEMVHLLALAILGGTILLVDLRLFGIGLKRQSASRLHRELLPLFWASFAVIVLSGIVILSAEPMGKSQITRKVPRPSATDSTYDVGPYKLYRPALEEGEGSREVSANCNTCHSLRYITMQPPLAADAWAAEVTKMVKTYGASISGDASQNILKYLQSHYTPENRKH